MKQFSPEQRERYLTSVLHPLVRKYQASEPTVKETQERLLTVLSGASGSGKDYVLGHTALHSVQSRTSRPQRWHTSEKVGKGYVHFYDLYNSQGRWDIFLDLVGHTFVQAEIFATGDVYGTKIEDYGPASVLNATYRTYKKLKELRLFRDTRQAFLVNPTPRRWIDQLIERDGQDHEQFTNRVRQGLDSVTEALEDQDTIFIINDDPMVAAEQLTVVAEGGRLSERVLEAGRYAGQLMKHVIGNGTVMPQRELMAA